MLKKFYFCVIGNIFHYILNRGKFAHSSLKAFISTLMLLTVLKSINMEMNFSIRGAKYELF